MTTKPILAITMGDPAGIGPEIIIKALSQKATYEKCNPIVTGDAAVMELASRQAGNKIKINAVSNVEDALFTYGTIDVYDLHCVDMQTFRQGEVAAQCGDAAFTAVVKAIELAMTNKVDGTVTAPLNKEALNLAGHHFDGHTEIYAHYTGTQKYAMLLADDFMRVIHVSTHVPLRQACDLVKKQRIIDVSELIIDACRQFGIEHPHIGIAGLNPHASDNGLFGYEEKEEIREGIDSFILSAEPKICSKVPEYRIAKFMTIIHPNELEVTRIRACYEKANEFLTKYHFVEENNLLETPEELPYQEVSEVTESTKKKTFFRKMQCLWKGKDRK